MNSFDPQIGCGSFAHLSRRTLLKAAGLSGLSWLTPLGESLARAQEKSNEKPRSVIILWMQGGPSQLDTFDPKPGLKIGGDVKAIPTRAKGIEIAAGLELVAEQMDSISLVRSVTSKEGDHERATYNMKTGFRPDPTLVHPAMGSIICHQMKDNVEIPRHVSILSNQWAPRGGYLGDEFDAFKINDPNQPIPDVKMRVPENRHRRRVSDLLDIIEPEFAKGRINTLNQKTLHRHSIEAAVAMMGSDQLKAFDVNEEPADVREMYGNTPFGRGCLAAVRLIKTGVRCVEVTLNGWDSHVNNHETQQNRLKELDPAFSALIADLKKRDIFDSTVVLWGGEFGRTPSINPALGRDHWPHGFTVAMAGGGIRGGQVIGETSPDPITDDRDKLGSDLVDPYEVQDIHATVLHALGIDFETEHPTRVGRPMAFSKGRVIDKLLS